jgi:hypothetical protein
MKQAIQLSGLTRQSQETLMREMSIDELQYMATLGDDVRNGRASLTQYRLQERAMMTKHGFRVKQV